MDALQRKRTRRFVWMPALVAAGMLVVGCLFGDDDGGDSGPTPDPTVNVTGTWDSYHTESGYPEQYGGAMFLTEDAYGNISGTAPGPSGTMAVSGTNSGGNLSITVSGGGFYTYATGVVTDYYHMQGTWSDSDGYSGTWRAERM